MRLKLNKHLLFAYRRNRLGIPKGSFNAHFKTRDYSSFNLLQRALGEIKEKPFLSRPCKNGFLKGEVFPLCNSIVFRGEDSKGYSKIHIKGGQTNVRFLTDKIESFFAQYVDRLYSFVCHNYGIRIDVAFEMY